jgi:diguanylate cyclase (GGDEF)-like protein
VLASHLAVSLSNARMVHKLETMATTDGLTGLFNKRAMLDAAAQKVQAAARFGRPLSVVIADIDLFKRVNDTHGHDVGDLVIKGLGEVLNRQKRATDVVARFGGEEFVVLCEQTDEAGAMLLAERIREDFERTTFHVGAGTVKATCSLGTATFPGGLGVSAKVPEAGRDWESLFKAADEALYASKHGGRNRSTAAPPRSSDGRERAAVSKRRTG